MWPLLEIDRPPHNFVSVELMRDLADALDDVDADRDLRVQRPDVGRQELLRRRGSRLADRHRRRGHGRASRRSTSRRCACSPTSKPIVAAIQGAAVGAGLGLALVADFRVVAPEARFTANFVKLGFHPGFGITHTLPRVVGEQRAALMCLTGRRIKAEEALAWGLADAMAPLEELRGRGPALWPRELAENAPLAVEATRATLRAGLAAAVKAQTDHELIEQTRLRATKDFAEGVALVNERRPGRVRRSLRTDHAQARSRTASPSTTRLSATGPALLLTHGYSATGEMWRGQVEPFSEHYRLITWDMRGHGRSDYPERSGRLQRSGDRRRHGRPAGRRGRRTARSSAACRSAAT